MHLLFEPGFFSSGPVHTAAIIGAVTAIVSAIVGVFTVVRSQSFAGHALTDVATTGGSGAFLLGLSPLTGFIGGGIVGGGAMELIGVERARSRDVATGIVLGAATGLSALFLYLDTTRSATTGATQQILFGSIFTIDPSTVPTVVVLSVVTLIVVGVIYRPLLLSSVSAELASARGISLRVVGLLFMLALAVSVGLSSIAIGSILSTALLIGRPRPPCALTRSLRCGDGDRLRPRGRRRRGSASSSPTTAPTGTRRAKASLSASSSWPSCSSSTSPPVSPSSVASPAAAMEACRRRVRV